MKVFKDSFLASVFTLLLSLISFGNQVLIAKYFGASGELDMYIAISSIPTLISGIIASGFNYSGLPAFVKQFQIDKSSLLPFCLSVLRLTFIVCFFLYIFLFISISSWDSTFYNSLNLDSYRSYNLVLLLSWLVSFLSVLLTVINCYFNAKRQFHIPILLSFLPFIFSILFTLFLHQTFGVATIAIGLFIGIFFALVWSWVMLGNNNFKYIQSNEYRNKALYLLKGVPYAAIAMLCFSMYQTVDSFWAPLLGKSNLAYLSYGQRITIAVGGLIIAGPFTVFVPKLTEYFETKMMQEFYSIIISILKTLLIFSIIIAVIISMFATDIIRLLFQGGNFSENDTIKLASIIPYYMIGMGFMLCSAILFRVLFITNNLKPAVAIGFSMTLIYIFASGILSSIFKLEGICTAYILTWIFTLLFSSKVIFKEKLSNVIKHSLIKDLFFAVVFASIIIMLITLSNNMVPKIDLWIKYCYIILISSFSIFIYLYSLYQLGVTEIRILINYFLKKINLQ